MTHPSPELLAGYLDDTLPGHDKQEVELHLSACAECRAEVTEVRRLQVRRRRRQLAGVLVPLAAAAAVVLMLVTPRDAGPPTGLRSGSDGEQPLEIVSPAPTAEVVAGPVAFAWRSAGTGANYTITLQEGDGRIAWRFIVDDTVAVAPDSIVFAPGRTWFWSVDALLPDGQSRSTGVQRLRIRP